MGMLYEAIDDTLRAWLTAQQMFFVATAPLAANGSINCSPKGLDTFRILGPREVAFLDLTDSGAETIAHLRENGRIVFMFCALAGRPTIVRLHGRGHVLMPDTPDFDRLRPLFPDHPGTRAVVRATIDRISDSCGYAVPLYDFTSQRETLTKWTIAKGDEGLATYRREKNARSIDGLPALS